ncbi:MAG: SRPBCC family protein [Acidimicrobiales bacterium]
MLERQVIVPVGPERLWEALTDQDSVSAWMGARVEWDVRPGGSAQFLEPDGTTRRGCVDEVTPASRLRFRWWAEGDEVWGTSQVSYELEPAEGGTRLTVTEVPLSPGPGPAHAAALAGGRGAGWTAWDSRLAGVWGKVGASSSLVAG